jgi:hypothetical protein
MKVEYSHKGLERVVIGFNIVAALVVIATFVCLFGFYEPLLPKQFLYNTQLLLLLVFIAEKLVRLLNAVSKKDFIRNYWFELPLLIVLGVILFGSGRWFGAEGPVAVRHIAVGIYLVVQVISKLSRTVVDIAASGLNPMRTLIISFLVLIFAGAGFLMLPRSAGGKSISFVDALFTATTATCVTGLTVKDTEKDFSLMGKLVILTLIQLGGLADVA